MENMGEDIAMPCSDSDNCSPEEMATPSKRPKLTEQSNEKETNDLKYQLEKQNVEIQELTDLTIHEKENPHLFNFTTSKAIC